MSYSMSDGLEVAKLATIDIEAWLFQKPETISIVNVEDNPASQSRYIDSRLAVLLLRQYSASISTTNAKKAILGAFDP